MLGCQECTPWLWYVLTLKGFYHQHRWKWQHYSSRHHGKRQKYWLQSRQREFCSTSKKTKLKNSSWGTCWKLRTCLLGLRTTSSSSLTGECQGSQRRSGSGKTCQSPYCQNPFCTVRSWNVSYICNAFKKKNKGTQGRYPYAKFCIIMVFLEQGSLRRDLTVYSHWTYLLQGPLRSSASRVRACTILARAAKLSSSPPEQ